VDHIDRKACLALQQRLKLRPWINLFRLLWPLGRSEFAMVALVGLAFYNLGQGASAAAAFVAWSFIDRLIKLGFKRVRPFNRLPATDMLQPRAPKDPSFPSGDAYHAWFLALTAFQVFHLPLWAALAVGLLAVLVSLGRIAMGVHTLLAAAASEFLVLYYFHPV
jgi:hypothetical protein